MIDAGIHSSDILIVDRSLDATDKKVVIAVVDGEFFSVGLQFVIGAMC